MMENHKENKSTEEKKALPIFIELFLEFFQLGIFTIGGGVAMLTLIEGIVVDRKKWLTHDELLECVTLSQSLPGVIAIHLATYVGRKKAGFGGALISVFALSLPSYIVIVLLMKGLQYVEGNIYIEGALWGIKLCVCALLTTTIYQLGKEFIGNLTDWIIAIGALAAVVFTDISVAYVIVVAAILGLIRGRIAPRKEGGHD